MKSQIPINVFLTKAFRVFLNQFISKTRVEAGTTREPMDRQTLMLFVRMKSTFRVLLVEKIANLVWHRIVQYSVVKRK